MAGGEWWEVETAGARMRAITKHAHTQGCGDGIPEVSNIGLLWSEVMPS